MRSNGSNWIPCCTCKRECNWIMILVHHCIPKRMKIIHRVVIRKSKIITTSITMRIVRIDSSRTMKRLMNISKVVNKKSHIYWLCLIFICIFRIHCSVDIVSVIAWLSSHPIHDITYDSSYIIICLAKIWIVMNVPSFI